MIVTIPTYRSQLYDKYQHIYPDFEFIKRGPNNNPHKTNMIIKTTTGEFVKIFLDSKQGIQLAKQEYELLQLFNEFGETHDQFSGPELLGFALTPSPQIVMSDVNKGSMD